VSARTGHTERLQQLRGSGNGLRLFLRRPHLGDVIISIRSTSTVLDADLQQGISNVRRRLPCYAPARSAVVSA